MNFNQVVRYYSSVSSYFSRNMVVDIFDILNYWGFLEESCSTSVGKDRVQVFRYIFVAIAKGISISRLKGRKSFLELTLLASQFSLIPRSETETISSWLSDKLSNYKRAIMADIGTGSGALALATSFRNIAWQVEAIDISSKALHNSRINAFINDISSVNFFVGFWGKDNPEKKYDIVVSNPPYIDISDPCLRNLYDEPIRALISARYGINSVSILAKCSRLQLMNKGMLVLEHSEKNAHIVRDILASYGYRGIVSHKDLLGNTRFTVAKIK